METHNIERSERCRPLKGEKGHIGLAHGISHVNPGQIGTLAGNALLVVQDVIEDGETLIGQADLIDIWVDQTSAIISLCRAKRAPLMVDIAAWLFNASKERLQVAKSIFVWNSHDTQSSRPSCRPRLAEHPWSKDYV